MSNLELLKKTRDFIKANPDQHDQEIWHCDTAACIAGHASFLAGAVLSHNPPFGSVLEYEGKAVAAPEFAQERLGLTWIEADYIFYCMDNQTALDRLDQIIDLHERGVEFDSATDWIEEELD